MPYHNIARLNMVRSVSVGEWAQASACFGVPFVRRAQPHHQMLVSGEAAASPAKKRKTTPRRENHLDSALDSGGDDDPVVELLCEACLGPGALTASYRGCVLHEECGNGIRAYNRIAAIDDVLKEEERKLFHNDRPQWRLKMLPFCKPAADRRLAIDALKTLKNRRDEFEENANIEGNADLTLRQFSNALLLDEGAAGPVAKAEFERRHALDPRQNADKENIVLYHYIVKREKRTGTRTSTLTDTVSAEQVAAARSRGLVASPSCPSTIEHGS